MKQWYKSKIVWLGVALVVKFVLDTISAPGWQFDFVHVSRLTSGLIGAAVAIVRASMPDLVTGLPFLDKSNPQPAPNVGGDGNAS